MPKIESAISRYPCACLCASVCVHVCAHVQHGGMCAGDGAIAPGCGSSRLRARRIKAAGMLPRWRAMSRRSVLAPGRARTAEFHLYGHECRHVFRHAFGMCCASLESSRRDGRFEHRHNHIRTLDMPSAIADVEQAMATTRSALSPRWMCSRQGRRRQRAT